MKKPCKHHNEILDGSSDLPQCNDCPSRRHKVVVSTPEAIALAECMREIRISLADIAKAINGPALEQEKGLMMRMNAVESIRASDRLERLEEHNRELKSEILSLKAELTKYASSQEKVLVLLEKIQADHNAFANQAKGAEKLLDWMKKLGIGIGVGGGGYAALETLIH